MECMQIFGPSLEQQHLPLGGLVGSCLLLMDGFVLWFGLLGWHRTPRLIGLDKRPNQYMDCTSKVARLGSTKALYIYIYIFFFWALWNYIQK